MKLNLVPLKLSLLALAIFSAATVMADKPKSKIVAKKWKMIKTEESGKEVDPKHQKLVLELTKKNEFSITAEYESTHKGTWKFNEDESQIILSDEETKEDIVLTIKDLDDSHLAFSGYDGDDVVLYMIPLGGKNSVHLSHKEHLVAKRWHVFESDNERNLGTMFEFKENRTFIIIPDGSKIPVFTGKWKMNEEHTKIILDMREHGEHMELSITELERHKMVLKNDETGVVNGFHDQSLFDADMAKLHPEKAEKKEDPAE